MRLLSFALLLAACETSPAVTPDAAADVAPDIAPDASPDAAPDVAPDAAPTPAMAMTASGPLRGVVEDGVARYLGVPYVAPPVGPLRWRAPAPHPPWTEPRDATRKGPACPQAPGTLLGTAQTAEDCLTLNVWAPSAPSATRRPVMVFIHGGGFVGGHASGPDYDGQRLAARGVVVVTFNYRLGQLGFLAHPSLSAEAGADGVSGNYGFLDQQAALRWVRDNIASFGGDPGAVTLFGESAGSMAVSLHLLAPGSRGLLHRAVMQSGVSTVMLTPMREEDARAPLESAYSLGRRFVTGVGCGAAADVPACLRAKSAAEVLAVLRSSAELVRFEARFQPNVDGRVLPETPWTAFHAGRFAQVPIMIGTNRDEGTIFTFTSPIADAAAYRAAVERLVPGHGDEVLTRLYPPAMYPSVNAAFNAFIADAAFICPSRDLARRYAAAGQPAFVYHFTQETAIGAQLGLGVFHAAELPYVFGNWSGLFRYRESDGPVVELTQGYWTRFALTADPNGAGATPWPRYTEAADPHLEIGAVARAGAGLRRAPCDAITAWLEPPAR